MFSGVRAIGLENAIYKQFTNLLKIVCGKKWDGNNRKRFND